MALAVVAELRVVLVTIAIVTGEGNQRAHGARSMTTQTGTRKSHYRPTVCGHHPCPVIYDYMAAAAAAAALVVAPVAISVVVVAPVV